MCQELLLEVCVDVDFDVVDEEFYNSYAIAIFYCKHLLDVI